MPEDSGLLVSARRFLSTLAGIAATRLELLANELQEEQLRWTQMLMLALLAVFCLCMAVLLLIMFLVVLWWEEHRLVVLGSLGAAFLAGGTYLVVTLQGKLRQGSRLFSVSLAELAKDKESLGERHE